MIRGDFHTHTTLCDGKDTPKAMVEAAIARGFSHIGFSAHAHTPCDESYCLSVAQTAVYKETVAALKETYKDQITVLCGIEQDRYSDLPTADYDYVIGSVHYVKVAGQYIPVDETADILRQAAVAHFGGDLLALAEAYYETVAELAALQPSVIGHLDLITKFNQGNALFDESDPRYLAAAKGAVDALLLLGVPFEVNTGAISRGYRDTPYPAAPLLRYIGEQGGRVILSGDAHSAEGLGFRFEKAAELATACGCPIAELP